MEATNAGSSTTSNKSKSEINYQEIIDLYNSICVSLPKAKGLMPKRKVAIESNRKAIESLGGFELLFKKAEASDFIAGRTPRTEEHQGWTADLNWLLFPRAYIKILEGSFDNKPSGAKKPPTAPTDPSEDTQILSDIYAQCELCDQAIWGEDIELAFKFAIDKLYYSESYKLGESVIPQAKIRSYLKLLDSDILSNVYHVTAQNGNPVKNTMRYLTSVLLNTLFEMQSDLLFIPYGSIY